jgi:hypothetical protein
MLADWLVGVLVDELGMMGMVDTAVGMIGVVDELGTTTGLVGGEGFIGVRFGDPLVGGEGFIGVRFGDPLVIGASCLLGVIPFLAGETMRGVLNDETSCSGES